MFSKIQNCNWVWFDFCCSYESSMNSAHRFLALIISNSHVKWGSNLSINFTNTTHTHTCIFSLHNSSHSNLILKPKCNLKDIWVIYAVAGYKVNTKTVTFGVHGIIHTLKQ